MKECQSDIVRICRRAHKIQGIVEIHLGVGFFGQGGRRVQYKNARTGERLIGMKTLSHWWLLNT